MKSLVREFPQGALIFKEGEVGNTAYILTEGQVEISIQQGEKKSVLARLKPVTVFGEMALLLRDQKRTATATAVGEAKVAEIVRRDFEDFMKQSPKLVNAVLTSLVERLKNTTIMVARAPDLFVGVAEILNLLMTHSVRGVRYNTSVAMIRTDDLVKSCSDAFLVPRDDINSVLTTMEALTLIEFKIENSQRYIDILPKTDFIDRCRKISETFTQIAASHL